MLGALGVISVVMVAPGLAKALPQIRKVNISRVNQEVKRLHKRGLVEIIKRKNGLVDIRLTNQGRAKLKSYEIGSLKIEKPKVWDKVWRIVIFDIPVNKNSSRTLIRRKMKSLGFLKLQQSVFIHPYPCLEIVDFLRNYFGVKSEVEYIEADKLESQDRILTHFFT